MNNTTAAEKARQIFKAGCNTYGAFSQEKFSRWLASPEGSRLVGELGEEKVGSSLIDLVKNLNWVKNLLSSITAAVIAGRDLDFVKHGTPFFEEMLMAYKSAKAILMDYENIVKGPPSAVTCGVKDEIEKAFRAGWKAANDPQARKFKWSDEVLEDDWAEYSDQPEQGGKPFMEGKDETNKGASSAP